MTIDSTGKNRILFDIAVSEKGLLYGNAWPANAFAGAQALIRTLWQSGRANAAASSLSELVLINVGDSGGVSVAVLSEGAPLKASLFGLGPSVPTAGRQ